MGCKQSTLRTETVAAAAPVAPKPQEVAVASPVRTETTVKASSVSPPRAAEEAAPAVDDILAEIFSEQVAIAASPRVESKAASPMRLGTRAPSTLNVAQAASPLKQEEAPAAEDKAAVISFSEFLAQQENTTTQKAEKPRKVLFDAETMRKSAPKSQSTVTTVPSTKLTKKQREMVKKQHVSIGRRGPVASRFEKGSKSQMQNDVYLQMASAFERLLTNADTINAHLDSR